MGLVDAPADFEATLGELPPGAGLERRHLPEAGCDVVVLFATREQDLVRHLQTAPTLLKTAGGLWIAWPKRASGVPTDLSDGLVRDHGLATGWVDNKVCAIDAVWSGLRFVKRLVDR